MPKNWTEQEQASNQPEYFTLKEIAAKWRVSKDTVRRIFQEEDNVLFLRAKHNNTRQGRVLVRIPATTVSRVESMMQNHPRD